MIDKRFTNEDIRLRYMHHQPHDSRTVDAHRQVRETLAGAAVALNDLLAEGDSKRLALEALEVARLHANTSVALDGPA